MKKRIALLAALLMFSTSSCFAYLDETSSTTPSETTSVSQTSPAPAETSSTTSSDITTLPETQAPPVTSDSQSVPVNPGPQSGTLKYVEYAGMSAEQICDKLSLEQKASQMVQPAVYCVDTEMMNKNCYGSILSKMNSISDSGWRKLVRDFQKSALSSESGVPFLYGQDDVHGVNYCLNAVYFPHNIGIGAAHDLDLTYKMGLAVADEAKICNMLWNFAPCVAQSADPRWGRTYESYGSDLDDISELGAAYTRGLVDGGIVACAKHFFGDGNVAYGTGENSDMPRLIDRGDARLSDSEIDALLAVYQAQIDAGAQTIMVSHSSLNGVKMHENADALKRLKEEMNFKGFVVSDWNSVQNTSPSTYKEQVITSVNAGIDMLMEVEKFDEAKQIIIDAVKDGDIKEERVNDAVTRILKVKLDAGIFEDPMCKNLKTVQKSVGSDDYRELSEKLVEESLVLLKNDGKVLPLKKGTKVYITGPAADEPSSQCGGWTVEWNGCPYIPGVTTIQQGFIEQAEKLGITVITDEEKASEADVVLLVVGEYPYAEWYGDTEDMSLCGAQGLGDNYKAIMEAKELQKPTVCCIVAGRQVLLDQDDYANWDSVVMCYLPGSEGQGVSDVLCGETDFTGKLPSPWYGSVDQIGTDECWLPKGYGLNYKS